MIRNLFVALFFFFGPALLMFVARTGFVLFRLWLRNKLRQAREEHDKVIDVTPVNHHHHPRWYVVIVVVVSLACSIAAFAYLQSDPAEQRRYVPAYSDDAGNIVPGHWQTISPARPAADEASEETQPVPQRP